MRMHYDKQNAEAYLGAAIIAFQNALEAAVRVAAETKGTDDLSWFDELHENAVRTAKGTTTEDIPVEVEAAAIRFGFEVVDAKFKSLRVSLLKDE